MDAFGGQGKRNLKRRMKRMTNPANAQFQAAAVSPDWSATYADLSLPLMVDIGCAKGRFLAALATSCKNHEQRNSKSPGPLSSSPSFAEVFGSHNFCGVEIFGPLVDAANHWRGEQHLKNLHYISGNVNTSFLSLFGSLPSPLRVTKVCVQFPDPWQKDNVAKRVVTPTLASQIAHVLPMGEGQLYIVSDMRWLAEDMAAIVVASGAFDLDPLHINQMVDVSADPARGMKEPNPEVDSMDDGLVSFPAQDEDNEIDSTAADGDDDDRCGDAPRNAADIPRPMSTRPFIMPTERDKVCETKWRPAYRFLFRRNMRVISLSE